MNRKLDAFFLCVWIASCAPEEPNPRYDARVEQAEAGDLDAGGVGQDASMTSDVSVDVGVSMDADAEADVVGGDSDVNTGADAPSACAEPCPPERSVCSPAGACEPCGADDDCARFEDTPICNDGACVACRGNADCQQSEASVCNLTTHRCQPCAADPSATTPADSDCQHLTATPICRAGTCVMCTAQRRAACGTDVCNALTHACETGKAVRSAYLCDACVSDAQCQEEQLCVPATFAQEALGAFCVPVLETSCDDQRPFAKAVTDGESIDGAQQPFCTLQYTTCAAVRLDGDGYRSNCGVDADGKAVETGAVRGENDLCGAASLDDGFCVRAGPGQFKCTVPCSPASGPNGAAPDCPDVAGPNDPTCTSHLHETKNDLLCTL